MIEAPCLNSLVAALVYAGEPASGGHFCSTVRTSYPMFGGEMI